MSFVADRDKAFTDAVLYDNWKGVRKFCKKYGMSAPRNNKVLKAGVYKAVQYCTKIPKATRDVAFEKCIKIGFSPIIVDDRDA